MNKIEGKITGLTFFNVLKIWNKLQVGTLLTLKRDINNQYDSNAIQILYNREQIGWVEKKDNVEIALPLEQGIMIITKITRVYGTPTSTPHLEVEYAWDQ